MFCPKCGEETRDGAMFCPVCGSSMQESTLPPKSLEVPQKQNNEGRKKSVRIVLIAGMLVLVFLAGLLLLSRSVNVGKYITIRFNGDDGKGTAEVMFNRDALFQAVKTKNNNLSGREKLRIRRCIDQMEVTAGKKDGLSNGDRVKAVVEYDFWGILDTGILLTGGSKSERVSGLKEIENEVEEKKEEESVQEKDDTEVEADVAVSEEEEEEYPISSMEDLSEKDMEKMKNDAAEVAWSYVNSKEFTNGGENRIAELDYKGYMFKSVKNGSESNTWSNILYLIYGGTASNKDGNYRSTTVYFPVMLVDLMKKGDSLSYRNDQVMKGMSSLNGTAYWTVGYVNPLTCYKELESNDGDNYMSVSGDGFERFSSVAAAAGMDKEIPEDSLYWNGHYYRCYVNCDSWEEAIQFCESVGGHMATISSSEENDAVYDYVISSGYNNAFIGFTDRKQEGKWEWVKSEGTGFTNWQKGEPNGENPEEDYAMFFYKFTDGKWNDGAFNRDEKSRPIYLCEWDSN